MNKFKAYFDIRVYTITLLVLTVIFFVSGSSLALWDWASPVASDTNVLLTTDAGFSCSADGGGNLTASNVQLQPTKCTNTQYAIKRQITYSSSISNAGLAIDYKLYLDINNISSGLLNSPNFKYAVTTSGTSCSSNVISSGKITNVRIPLINERFVNSASKNIYLWIWLDEQEVSEETMDQSFSASLSGTCEISPNQG